MLKPFVGHILAFSVCLAGCSSTPISRLKATEPSNRAEVVMLRESAFNAGGISLAVGINGTAFAMLENADYASIYVRPDTYDFFVRARTADPTILKLEIKAGERRCLKTVADPNNLWKVSVPFLLISSGYRFLLQEVTCPSDGVLTKYSKVKIEYQDH